MIAGFAALLVTGATAIWLVRKTAADTELVVHSQTVQNLIQRIFSLAQDGETGQRGYLLTGDAAYLGPYERATAGMPEALQSLQRMTADNPAQQARISDLTSAVQDKLAELGQTISIYRSGRQAEAFAAVRSGQGREAMARVRAAVGELSRAESELLGRRSADSAATVSWLLGVSLAALLLIAGVAAGSLLVVRRYTSELHRAQAELAQANTGLEEVVAARTAELVRANEEVQRFAYIVSHDLRSPLVNIMGFTSELDASRQAIARQFERLAETAPGLVGEEAKLAVEEDLPEAIGFIRASTTKMDRLINAILKLSRDGRRTPTPERIAVGDMVAAIAATLQQQTSAAGAEIEIGALPALVSDRLALEQIFSNLIENAVKYLDASRPGRIAVRGRAAGPRIVYEIADNGRGIDPKDHERIFELFRRSGAQDRPGEGLGLSFVRNSVRRLGGTITVASAPGRGSTFTLDFPRVLQRSNESLAA
ncbi:histidine kinase [Chelatococcus reniformis]|uniref:histidine kinase n=2 Tax=Chelatococcus reniformis TaxID=1494448 RepID=A0A916X8J1_9HYPH|nr:histidine kinase [Chelatococcus reniformis]